MVDKSVTRRVHKDFDLWLTDFKNNLENISGKSISDVEFTRVLAKAQIHPITIVDKTRKRIKKSEFDIW